MILTDPWSSRVAVLRASYEVFEIDIPEVDACGVLAEYDDEAKEAVLRALANVACAYLDGSGEMVHKRGLPRRRTTFAIDVNGDVWELGRRWIVVHYPA